MRHWSGLSISLSFLVRIHNIQGRIQDFSKFPSMAVNVLLEYFKPIDCSIRAFRSPESQV